jgi:hypothetical protein
LFPGSAWEHHVDKAPPRIGREGKFATRMQDSPDRTGGRASRTVRSQAEPGNEETETSKEETDMSCPYCDGKKCTGKCKKDKKKKSKKKKKKKEKK